MANHLSSKNIETFLELCAVPKTLQDNIWIPLAIAIAAAVIIIESIFVAKAEYEKAKSSATKRRKLFITVLLTLFSVGIIPCLPLTIESEAVFWVKLGLMLAIPLVVVGHTHLRKMFDDGLYYIVLVVALLALLITSGITLQLNIYVVILAIVPFFYLEINEYLEKTKVKYLVDKKEKICKKIDYVMVVYITILGIAIIIFMIMFVMQLIKTMDKKKQEKLKNERLQKLEQERLQNLEQERLRKLKEKTEKIKSNRTTKEAILEEAKVLTSEEVIELLKKTQPNLEDQPHVIDYMRSKMDLSQIKPLKDGSINSNIEILVKFEVRRTNTEGLFKYKELGVIELRPDAQGGTRYLTSEQAAANKLEYDDEFGDFMLHSILTFSPIDNTLKLITKARKDLNLRIPILID